MEECIRLRKEKRMSFPEISALHGVSFGTLNYWLKPYPLTKEEQKERRKKRIYKTKDRGEVSKFWQAINCQNLTRLQKSKIAESAVLFRLVLHGFIPYRSIFDGDKVDWFVEVPETGKKWKIQVRWTKGNKNKKELPRISLICIDGHSTQRKFKEGEFDFIVGYDLYTDTAYVFSFEEVLHLSCAVTIRKEAAEAWDKLRV